ncbi:MAG: hypothetical protein WDM78_01645 [Puia sp.]
MVINFTDPYLESEDILDMVNEGMIPFTVVPEDLGTLWKSAYTNLKVYPNIAVDSNVSYGWAIREKFAQIEIRPQSVCKHDQKRNCDRKYDL